MQSIGMTGAALTVAALAVAACMAPSSAATAEDNAWPVTAQAAVDPAAAAFVLSLYSLNIGGTGEAVPEFDSDLDVSLTLAFTQPDVRRTRTFNLVKEGGQ